MWPISLVWGKSFSCLYNNMRKGLLLHVWWIYETLIWTYSSPVQRTCNYMCNYMMQNPKVSKLIWSLLITQQSQYNSQGVTHCSRMWHTITLYCFTSLIIISPAVNKRTGKVTWSPSKIAHSNHIKPQVLMILFGRCIFFKLI